MIPSFRSHTSRLRRVLTTLMLLVTLLPAVAYDFEVDGIYYNIIPYLDKSCEVTYLNDDYNSYSGDIVIPSSVNYDTSYSVTSIGWGAFRYCTGLTSIKIPNSVTDIDPKAFEGCTGLNSLEIPNSVTSIGVGAFEGCTGLTSIEIPNSVTEIYSNVFRDCTGLTSLKIEDGKTELSLPDSYPGEFVFQNCKIESLYVGRNLSSWVDLHNSSYLSSVAIGNSVTQIGECAFEDCTGLTSLEIPNSVTAIGSSAFSGCTGLTSIEIPNSVTAIDTEAFKGCTSLKQVNITNLESWYKISFNDQPLEYAHHLFLNGEEITELVIPNTLSTISRKAFSGCTGLTSIEIPNSVTSIGSSAFSGCTGLTSIEIPNSVTTIGSSAFSGCTGLTSIEIPNSVTTIGSSAFSGCTGLTSIEIPNSVTTIGSSAFFGCTGLTSIEIPNSVTSIGGYAFSDCTGLRSLKIEDGKTVLSLEKLNGYTFANCKIESLYVGRNLSSWKNLCLSNSSYLSSVTIGNSVTSIGISAFENCVGLKSLRIEDGDTELSLQFSGSIYPFNECKIESLYVGRNLSLWQALCNSSYLSSVTIGNSVTQIGAYAFSGCTGLTSIEIPNSVTLIDGAAFSNCTGLTSIEIPNSVTSIWGNAFSDCTGLKSLWIEDGDTELVLKLGAFIGNRIESIYIGRDLSSWNELYISSFLSSVTIGNSVTSIGGSAFYGCTGLTSIEIPNSVTSIGSSAFKGCTGLTSIEIPNSVTSIGSSAFEGCTGLTSIEIPNSVTSIDFWAFNNCTGLKSLKIEDGDAELALSRTNYPFRNCKIEFLYVGRNLSSWMPLNNSLALNSLTVGSDVTSITEGAFNNCAGLKNVSFLDGEKTLTFNDDLFANSALEDVLIGRNIEGGTFKNINTLATAWISDNVTEIPDYLFYQCQGLNNLYVGDGLTKISDFAFSGCSGLKVFNFGKSISSIEQNAFSECTGLENLYAEPTMPPTVASHCFDDIDKEKCVLHHPAGAPYDTASQWMEFLLVDNDFPVTMTEETITAEAGDIVTVTAQVNADVDLSSVVWRSSNPQIAEVIDVIVPGASDIMAKVPGTTISANVQVHKKAQVTIAAFLPTGQMANCILNKDGIATGVDKVYGDDVIPTEANDEHQKFNEYQVFNMQGVLLMRGASAEKLGGLEPGVYIINGEKIVIR